MVRKMTLDQVIEGRRSIRTYSDEMISSEVIQKIIHAGMWAPTACNKQDYRFIIIDDEEIFAQLDRVGTAHFVKNCKQAILVLYDNSTDNVDYHDDVLSAGAVIQNMLLKATELKVATCWVCNLPTKPKMRRIFGIPRHYDPIALVAIGYMTNEAKKMPRKKDVNEVIYRNRIPDGGISEINMFRKKIRRVARFFYVRLPKTQFLKKISAGFERKFDN